MLLRLCFFSRFFYETIVVDDRLLQSFFFDILLWIRLKTKHKVQYIITIKPTEKNNDAIRVKDNHLKLERLTLVSHPSLFFFLAQLFHLSWAMVSSLDLALLLNFAPLKLRSIISTAICSTNSLVQNLSFLEWELYSFQISHDRVRKIDQLGPYANENLVQLYRTVDIVENDSLALGFIMLPLAFIHSA